MTLIQTSAVKCATNVAAISMFVLCGSVASALFSATARAADSGAAVEQSPAAWLDRMNVAFAELDYDGVFSYWSSGNMASLRVVHVAKNDMEHERLVHLNGAPREIVRDGDKVLCIMQPGDRLLSVGSSIPAGPFAKAFLRDFSAVANNYELAMKGEDRIAARPAVRMTVMPKDEHRYGYRLWIDKETGLLLKSELMDEAQHAALEVFQFNQLRLGGDVSADALTPVKPSGSVLHHLRVANESESAIKAETEVKWHADWLPEGFEMAASDLRHAPATKQDVSTLMYSDGLAAISVFVEDLPNDAATNMLSRKGATVSVTRRVTGPNEAHHLVTVIGEVPPETATAIASNVSYSN